MQLRITSQTWVAMGRVAFNVSKPASRAHEQDSRRWNRRACKEGAIGIGALGAAACATLLVLATSGGGLAQASNRHVARIGASADAQDGTTVLLTIVADADATVDSSRPTRALGATRALTVGNAVGEQLATTQALLHFPLSALPPGSTVVTATLLLDMTAHRGQAEIAVMSAAITSPWNETEVTWASRPMLSRDATQLVGPAPDRLVVDVTKLVATMGSGGDQNHGLAIVVDDGGCNGGRSRTFASRETGTGEGPTATLTSTPTASATATNTPTPTARATATATASATSTSTFGEYKGQPEPIRPSDGIHLPQPIGEEVWVFEWSALRGGRGPCYAGGTTLTLNGPDSKTTIDLPGAPYGGCYRFHSSDPVAAGTWGWRVAMPCGNGPTNASEYRRFVVAAAPTTQTPPITSTSTSTATATAQATATATPTPSSTALDHRLWLPFAGKQGEEP